MATAYTALRLFESGLSRAEVGGQLEIGADRVKDLLSLARFLRDPTSHPSRLQLARQAESEGWTKGAAPRGNRYRRALTDARDLHRTWPPTTPE